MADNGPNKPAIEPSTLVRMSLRDIVILICTIVGTSVAGVLWLQSRLGAVDVRSARTEALVIRQGDALLQLQAQSTAAQSKADDLARSINALATEVAKLTARASP